MVAMAFSAAVLVAPLVVLVAGNDFTSSSRTRWRVVVAIIIGWALLVVGHEQTVTSNLAQAATEAEMRRVADGDGAAGVFAVGFGWLPASLIALFWWVVARVVLLVRRRAATPGS